MYGQCLYEPDTYFNIVLSNDLLQIVVLMCCEGVFEQAK